MEYWARLLWKGEPIDDPCGAFVPVQLRPVLVDRRPRLVSTEPIEFPEAGADVWADEIEIRGPDGIFVARTRITEEAAYLRHGQQGVCNAL